MRIMIVGQFATNKGDRAIAEYLISRINFLIPSAIIVLSSNCPSLWNAKNYSNLEVIDFAYKPFIKLGKNRFLNKIKREINHLIYRFVAFPKLYKKKKNSRFLNRHFKSFIEQIKMSDLVIITGGHHITSIRSKNALFSTTFDIGLVSLFSDNYFLWSQTIGPLHFTDKRAHDFFQGVFENSKCVFYRDENSLLCLNEVFDVNFPVKYCPDSVFGFRSFITPCDNTNHKKKVGISIFNGLFSAYKNFSAIAALLDFFVANGYEIEFFKMEYGSKETEDIESVVSMMSKKGSISIFPFETNTIKHLDEIRSCDLFVGYKTHSVIMSLTAGIPLIALCYHKKTYEFMKMFDVEKYAVDDSNVSQDYLLFLANELIKNRNDVSSTISKKANEISYIVDNNFSTIIRKESKSK